MTTPSFGPGHDVEARRSELDRLAPHPTGPIHDRTATSPGVHGRGTYRWIVDPRTRAQRRRATSTEPKVPSAHASSGGPRDHSAGLAGRPPGSGRPLANDDGMAGGTGRSPAVAVEARRQPVRAVGDVDGRKRAGGRSASAPSCAGSSNVVRQWFVPLEPSIRPPIQIIRARVCSRC